MGKGLWDIIGSCHVYGCAPFLEGVLRELIRLGHRLIEGCWNAVVHYCHWAAMVWGK